jgi:hypothetical protein
LASARVCRARLGVGEVLDDVADAGQHHGQASGLDIEHRLVTIWLPVVCNLTFAITIFSA